MNLSAAQMQRKREKKARKRRYYAERKMAFFSSFGPYVGAHCYSLWRLRGGWWPMRRGRLRQLIKDAVKEAGVFK